MRGSRPVRTIVFTRVCVVQVEPVEESGERRGAIVGRIDDRSLPEVAPGAMREVVEGDVGCKERMAAPCDDACGDVDESLAAEELWQAFGDIYAAGMQVGLAVRKQAQALGPRGGLEGNFDSGTGILEPGNGLGEHGRAPDRVRGDAVTRKRPVRPARASSIVASAASISCRMPRARSVTVTPRGVRRTPTGRRSNSRPPNRRSSRAMMRVSAGCVMPNRPAAAPILPDSATASSRTRLLRFSNIPPFPGTSRPAACSFYLDMGAGIVFSTRPDNWTSDKPGSFAELGGLLRYGSCEAGQARTRGAATDRRGTGGYDRPERVRAVGEGRAWAA